MGRKAIRRHGRGGGEAAAPGGRRAIVMPLDGTRAAVAALPVARTLAALWHVPMHIVHAADVTLPPSRLQDALQLSAREIRGAAVQQVGGDPARGILAQAATWQSPAIVLCSHTRQEKPFGALGRVASDVLRGATCPVVLVQPERGSVSWPLRHVLVPYDGTPATGAALGPAVELGARSGAALDILFVAGPTGDLPAEPGTLKLPRYIDQPHHEWVSWQRELAERLQALCGCPLPSHTRLFLRTGQPGAATVALALAERSDLIVLVWHSNLGPNRAKVVRAVMDAAPCPVMLLPVPRDAREEDSPNHPRGREKPEP